MSIRITNTLSRKKEDFTPQTPDKISMYVCGVTVYDMCHIGHARSQVVFDTIYRHFKRRNFNVKYVRNFTDIDDKIIARANKDGIPWNQITAKYIDEFYRDADALNLLRPDVEPRATDHIEDIIKLVQTLIDKGYAYQLGGDVYYSVRNFSDYGKLSGRNFEDMKAGARVEIDERKQDPLDFALWKESKPSEPYWESPWGRGRPGWHIECSCMSNKHLGPTLDIHGGGKDLVFPHHENEIAQSEAANGQEFVRYWIHNGFVNIDQEKMSKSLQNFFTIREVLSKYPPEVLRYFLLSVHYLHPIDYSDQNLDEAAVALDRLYKTWAILHETKSDQAPVEIRQIKGKQAEAIAQADKLSIQFEESMDDDFNTPKAISFMHEMAHMTNMVCRDCSLSRGPEGTTLINFLNQCMETMGKEALGFFIRPPKAYLEARAKKYLEDNSISIEWIQEMIQRRNQARNSKDFSAADAIRNKLLEKGILVKDTPSGTTWEVK